jgi:hypothetical protein
MAKTCERCQGRMENTTIAVCGRCSRRCEWCGARLGQLNYAQSCGLCKSGEVLGKATHKLGLGRLAKHFLRTLYSNKK